MTARASEAADAATALARDAVRGLALYAGADTPCAVDVSDNTNLWGTPPAALQVIRAAAGAGAVDVARYPHAYTSELSGRLVSYLGFPATSELSVVTGCGSDDVLDAAMRAFSVDGARIAYSVPTFSMISTFARLNGLETVEIPLADDFDLDVDRLIEARAHITYICAPNNPTGTAVRRDAVEKVLAGTAGIVIVDEAYGEFASGSLIDLVASCPRLLVTRTFSKAFGLAGVRLGYGVGSEALVGLVARARGPYKVNTLAERAALAALGDGPDALGWVNGRVQEALEMRERLHNGLSALGLEPLRSDANFIFVPLREAAAVASHMMSAGVRVRAMSGLAGPQALRSEDGAGLRIGVGPADVMDAVLVALRTALATVAPDRISGLVTPEGASPS